ncbi:organic solute transporter subunit alpha isoform X2 [Carettochelys insculpta]|uniref:organic solute transporter subunit alpha isoform X2 n=1 Tax=Carettochelys insculpta TaxID=44489 RepID=UPI003EB747CF
MLAVTFPSLVRLPAEVPTGRGKAVGPRRQLEESTGEPARAGGMEPAAELQPDPRIPPHLVELLTKNFSIPLACISQPPTSQQMLHQLDNIELSILGLMTFLVLVSVVIFLEEVTYLFKKIRCLVKRKTLIWSSSAPMMVSVFCCFGLWIPRSMMVVEMAIGMYYSVCFYLLMLVMVEGFGGKEALLKALRDTPMAISTGPCCCCCPCCPRVTMTKRKLQLFLLGTFQFTFFKTASVFVGLTLAADGSYDPADISAQSVAVWINSCLGVSTMFALWALGILFRQARTHLKEQNMGAKFVCFQVLLILTALQPAILSILASSGQIACSPPLPSRTRSQYMSMQLIIMETFLMTVVTRMYYRKQDDKAGYQPFSPLDGDVEIKPSTGCSGDEKGASGTRGFSHVANMSPLQFQEDRILS